MLRVAGIAGDAPGGDIHMGGLGPHHGHLGGGGLVGGAAARSQQAGQVVVVHHGGTAFAPADGTGDWCVGGEVGLLDIGHQALQPGCRSRLATLNQLVCHQRLVVDVGPIAQAQLSLQFWPRQVGIGADQAGFH